MYCITSYRPWGGEQLPLLDCRAEGSRRRSVLEIPYSIREIPYSIREIPCSKGNPYSKGKSLIPKGNPLFQRGIHFTDTGIACSLVPARHSVQPKEPLQEVCWKPLCDIRRILCVESRLGRHIYYRHWSRLSLFAVGCLLVARECMDCHERSNCGAHERIERE